MAAAGEISPEAMAGYRAGARRRQEIERQALAAREERAWELARRAADVLRQQFQASRVVVFGSLIHPGCFTAWSDVDVAAWDLRLEDTFRAIGVVMDLDAEIPVNLVDVNACKPSILEVIVREGVPL